MKSLDDQLIFEKYDQLISEIGLPGGQQYSIGSRLGAWAGRKIKNATGGLVDIGKGAQSKVNIEKDSNYFLRTLKDDARNSGVDLNDMLRNPEYIERWLNSRLKINNIKDMPGLEQLISNAANGDNADIYKLISSAVLFRNKSRAFGASSQPPPFNQQQSTAAPQQQQPTEPQQQPTEPQQQQSTEPQQQQPAANAVTAKQARSSIDQAVDVIKKVRSRDRANQIKYAKQKLDEITPKSAKTAAQTPTNVVQMPAAAAESVYICANIITENIKLIDCTKF